MKITNIVIENFLVIAQATLALDSRGLLLVQGENRDDTSANSNGAGKSSVPDAICWAMFGSTARGVTGDDVINDKAGKGALVKVTLCDSGETYHITRGRKHKTLKNSVRLEVENAGGKTTDLTQGTDKLTQKKIEEILGCSEEVFRAAVYTGQEQMPDLPALTDKPLKELIEQAAGIQVIEKAHEIARKRLTKATGELAVAAAAFSNATATLVSYQAEALDLSTKASAWDAGRAALIAGMEAELLAKAEAQKIADTELAKKLEGAEKVAAAVAGLDTRIASVAAEQTRLDQLEEALAKSRSAHLLSEAALRTERAALTKLDGRIANTEALVGTPCGECGKAYEDHDIETTREHLVKSREQAEQLVTIAGTRVDALWQTVESAVTERDAFKQSMTDLSKVHAQRARALDALRAVDALKASNARAQQELVSHQVVIDERRAEQNPFTPLIADKNLKITAAIDALALSETSAEDLRGRVALAEQAVAVYGPAGVRAHILDHVTPYLNDRTASYLGLLSDGNISATWQTLEETAKGDWREKFSIAVTGEKLGMGKSFAGLSGGEKRKVRLSCALALQDLVSSRATKPIEFWCADEIDHALDAAGLERLMGILEEKGREHGTVLVISHNDLNDWIRNSITMIKENDVSRLEDAA